MSFPIAQKIEKIYWPHTLSRKQAAFISSPAKFKLFDGGYGSGKSLAGVYAILDYCINHPYCVCLCATLVYDQLKQSLIEFFLEIFDECNVDLLRSYNVSDKVMILHNGSKIIFRSCDTEIKFKSLNLDAFLLDEATDVQRSVWLQLLGRLRRKSRHISHPKQAFVTTNPSDQNNWVYKFFYKNENMRDNIFTVSSTYRDNKHLPLDFYEAYKSYSSAYVARYLEGEWNNLGQGLVYECFDPSIHLGSVDPKKHTSHFLSLDIGTRDPTVALYITVTNEKEIYVYDEYFATNTQSFENIDLILKKNPQKFTAVYVDPSAADFKLQLRKRDLPVFSAKNDINNGIQTVTSLFNQHKIKIHPRCKNTIRELRMYKWPENKDDKPIREIPIDQYNHCMDALRYFCHSYYGKLTRRNASRHVEAIC